MTHGFPGDKGIFRPYPIRLLNRVGSTIQPCWAPTRTMNRTKHRAALWFTSVLAAAAFSLSAQDVAEVCPPPSDVVERLSLDRHYEKYIDFRGFPIVASAKVSDYALKEAAYLIDMMIGSRPDIISALATSNFRLAIMSVDEFTTDIPEHSDLTPADYWNKRARGLGATKIRPAVSVGEENLLGLEGDPYAAESIFVHEFAHVIHQVATAGFDPDFQTQLEQAFARAKLAGKWKGKYAGTNPSEYWAESVQSWFDTNRENDSDHNEVNTREELKEYDPAAAALVESVFGDGEWRYLPPAQRAELLHLTDFDRTTAPSFSWPPELVAAFDAIERGDHLESVSLQAMELIATNPATGEGGISIQLRFDNRSHQRISVYWIGFDGIRRHYADIDPGRRHEQQTYGGHLWVIVGEDGRDIGWLPAPESDGLVAVN